MRVGPGLADGRAVFEFSTDCGELKVVPEPVGTRGYEDLRRAAMRQPLGRGARPSVASIGDLARMVAARRLGVRDERDVERLIAEARRA